MAGNIGAVLRQGGVSRGEIQKYFSPGQAMPEMPQRKWWQFLPGFKQVYEDKLARWQTEYDRWSLEDQRRYDSPQQEVSRFTAANMSPALAYQQSSGGQQPSSASKPGDVGSLKLMDGLSAIMDLNMKGAQIRNIEADTQKKKYEGRVSESQWTAATQSLSTLDESTMTVQMKQEVDKMKKLAAEAKTAEAQTEVTNMILQWYAKNQIFRFIGPLISSGMGMWK